jgi:outer membrane protein OmpA-like peptidoglycan-associated protein
MTNTGKGALIGGTSGTALGAGIGALIGKGKGAAIGAAVGAAVGTGAGALIGKKMDKQQAELAQQLADQATVEQTTDANGLQAIKVTFEGGILFATGKADLTSQAKADLTKFANNLNSNLNTDVQIFGYTDNTGSYEANQKVSTNRANAVKTYLTNNSVSSSRLTATGVPMSDYIASNDTEAGRAQNRRVEIYIYANETMIQQAEAGTLQ